jgi:lipopolysaccharide biosynthesis protein
LKTSLLGTLRGALRTLREAFPDDRPGTPLRKGVDAPAAAPPHSTAHQVYFELLRRAEGGGDEYVPRETEGSEGRTWTTKVVALYRPPADWTKVTRALPRYAGHYQPRIPDTIGYYDLRVPDVMRRQVDLARQYGVHAFCFDSPSPDAMPGAAPLGAFLADPTLDLAFCVWLAHDGGGRLPPLEALRDRRYLRLAGKPLVVLEAAETGRETEGRVQELRTSAEQAGIGDLLVALSLEEGADPRPLGADLAVEHPPLSLADRVTADRKVTPAHPQYSGSVLDYRTVADHGRNRPPRAFPAVPTVIPSWDSEPAEPGRGCSFINATPDRYERWLAAALEAARKHPVAGEALVFVNGWNNWTEGAYLEPDRRYGYAFLRATRRALAAAEPAFAPAAAARPPLGPPAVVVHAYYPELLPEMLEVLGSWRRPYELHVTAPAARLDEIRGHVGRAGIPAMLHAFANRGRDVLPFLRLARGFSAGGERLILKLHTKRSLHRGDGEIWRRDLMGKLLAPESAARIEDAMTADRSIGMVGPEGHVLSLRSFWGSNRVRVNELAYRMGLAPVQPENLAFVGGSMFWASTAALRPLLELDLDADDFEPEAGQVDGTLAHAVERALALSTLRAGLRLTDSADPTTDVAEARCRYLHAAGEEAPSALPLDFDPAAYLRANPDVQVSGQDPARHFLTIGWSEGRRW